MSWFLVLPIVLQSILILVDEVYFHRRRGLSDWEVYGHPLDSLSVAATLAVVVFAPFSSLSLTFYSVLAVFSSVFVTKDEFLHAQVCTPVEHWLHSLLFVLHPVVFMAAGWLWYTGEGVWFLRAQLGLVLCFTLYQFFYWKIRRAALGANQ